MVKKITDPSILEGNTFKPSKGVRIISSQTVDISNDLAIGAASSQFKVKNLQSPDVNKSFSSQTVFENGKTQTFANNRANQSLPGNFSQFSDIRDPGILNRSASFNPGESLTSTTNVAGIEGLGNSFRSKAEQLIGRALGSKSQELFRDNILDTLDNVTYNFKLLLGSEEVLFNRSEPPNLNLLHVVAQSGVTSKFIIDDVAIKQVVGPNSRTRNTQAVNFEIDILEPQGISLIDQILGFGKRFNIGNIMNVPWFLELSFRGYTQTGIPIEVEAAKKYWSLQLIDINTNMDLGGTKYKMSFVESNFYGFHKGSSASIFKQQLNIETTTVGEFFRELGFRLTLQDTILATAGYQTRNEYEFFVDPDMREWKIGQSALTPNVPSMFIEENDRKSLVIEPGKKLEEVVDIILATTKEMEEKANPESTPNKLDEPQKGPKNSQIALVSCEVELLGYNPRNKEYIRKFKYYISLYDAWRALPEKPEQTDQETRIQSLFQRSLKKKYAYIYTGENTDVLELDIELDALWRHATSYYAYAQHRTRNNNSNFIDVDFADIENPDDIRSQIQQREFSANQQIQQSATFSTDGIQGPVLASVGPPDPQSTREQLQSRLERLRSSGLEESGILRSQIEQLDRVNQVIPLEGQNGSQSNSIGNFGESSQGSILNRVSNFARDGLQNLAQQGLNRLGIPLNVITRGSQSFNAQLLESLNFRDEQQGILNFFIRQTDPGLDISHVQKNFEETTEYSRSIFGIITNQMYGITYGQLQQIKMTVRGDPYWMGESTFQTIQRLRSFQIEETLDPNSANYLVGEQSFLLTFKTPVKEDEFTGVSKLQEQTTFKGVYTVYYVESNFSQGKFTQTLTAIRDLNTDASAIG
jgi:hypothetical protein